MSDAALPLTDVPDKAPQAEPAHAGAPPDGDKQVIARHSVVVRITHWINLFAIIFLLLSGLQIFNAHPMLYWGNAGADGDPPFVSMSADDWRKPHPRGVTRIGPIVLDTTGVFGVSGGEIRGYPSWLTLPASRDLATGRRWHFFMAWVFVLNGLIYLVSGVVGRHFRRDLAPTAEQLRPSHIWRSIIDHIRLKHPAGEEAKHYNVLQKFAYLGVILFMTLMVLTGLTMSPGIDAFAPLLPILFGGRQSARTVHWICANLIVLFVLVHVIEVFIAGAVNEIGSMITGRYTIKTGAGH